MEIKHLDEKGLEKVFEIVSQKDKNLEDDITLVLNGIAQELENKADKSEIINSDWNAEEGENGFIENKPILNPTVSFPENNQIFYSTTDNKKLGMDVDGVGNFTNNKVVSDEYYQTFGIITYENEFKSSPVFSGKIEIARLKSVIFPYRDEFTISNGTFNGAINLESVICPNFTAIGGYAFLNCKKLKEFEISDNLKSIESNCFQNCISLEKIDLPEGLVNIKYAAFAGCSSLKQIEIPSTATNIGSDFIFGCDNLIKFVIKSPIEDSARLYYNCPSLEYIDWSQTKRESVSITGRNILDYKLPNTVKRFSVTDTKLTSIDIPSSVDTIGDYGFANNIFLRKVFIPGNVKSIGENPFRNCPNLEYLKIDCTTPFGNNSTYQRPSPIIIDTKQTVLGATMGEPSRLQELILRSGSVVKDLDTYLATPTQNDEDEIMPIVNLDEWIGKPNNWLKIFVPENLLSKYIETYPTLKNYIHPITGVDTPKNLPIVQETGYSEDTIMSQKAVTNALPKIWTGTQTEYETITTKDPNTFYFIKEED